MQAILSPEENVHIFDARGIARRFRHAAVFGALGALRSGETMRFINDHDPLPLLAQLGERFGGCLAINYRERGPQGVVVDLGIIDLPDE
jgi:uncharacterized protein (DUF2249 family)